MREFAVGVALLLTLCGLPEPLLAHNNVGTGPPVAGDCDEANEAGFYIQFSSPPQVWVCRGTLGWFNASDLSNSTGAFVGPLLVDDEQELRLGEEDAGGANYIAFRAPAAITANQLCVLEDDANPIPDSCVGDGVDGGGGGSITIEEADASPSVANATKLQFDQADGLTVTDETGGQVQIDLSGVPFAVMAGLAADAQVDGSVEADEVNPTLGTQTQGFYVASLASGLGLTGGAAGSEGAALTLAFDTSATLAGDPVLAAGQCVFTTGNGNGGGFLCEGENADAVETAFNFLSNPDADASYGITVLGSSIEDAELSSNYSGVGGCAANTWASTLNDNAAPTCTQPAFANVSGAAGDSQVDGSLEADEVNPALGSQTQGNYVSNVADGTGIDVTGTAGEDWTATVNLSFAATLAGDPTLAAEECVPTLDGTGSGGWLCEGATADAAEQLHLLPSQNGADTTDYIATADSSGNALAGDSATAFFTVGAIEVARGGTGAAPGGDDQVLVSSSSSAASWLTVPDSDAAGTILGYDQTSNAFSTKTDDDVPESGDFTNLTAGRSLTISSGTVDADAELYTDTKCINVDPEHTTTDWFFFRAEAAITVTGVDCIVDAATSVVMTLRECDANGGTCATEAAITWWTPRSCWSWRIDDSAVDAGDWMRVLRGTVTGSPTQATLCVTYTVND